VNKHILVFDSGLGGTTVLQEIQQRLPALHYSYVLDNGGFPYSNKSDAYLLERTMSLFNEVIPHCQPDLIVIACNTASTLILQHLRTHFSLPFVGVVPAIKPAAALSKSKVIGLLATEATVKRDYINQLSTTHAEKCEIIRFGSQKLVEIAENKIQGIPITIEDIKTALKPLYNTAKHDSIDVFVLGCTHFPALKDELVRAWPHPVQFIDSGEAIARRVDELCQSIPEHITSSKNTLYLTQEDLKQQKQKTLERFGISHCHIVQID
jgi:glutamate racemase